MFSLLQSCRNQLFCVLAILFIFNCMAFAEELDVLQESDTFASKYVLAEEYWQKEKYDEAKALYQDIAANCPDSNLVMKSRAWVAGCDIYLGNDSAAEQAIEALKNDYSAHNGLCVELDSLCEEYWYKQEYDKAKALYQYISQNSPDSELVMKSIAWIAGCEIHLGNDSAAEQAIEALKNDYTDYDNLNEKIVAIADEYWNLKRYDKAKTLYQYISQNSPDSELVMKSRAWIVGCDVYLGNGSAAQQEIEMLWSTYSSIEEFAKNIHFIMIAYNKAGQYAASQALFDRLLTELPNDPYIPVILTSEIRRCLKSGDTEGADEKAEELLKHNQSASSFITAAKRVIIAYGRKNDYGKVLELCNRVLAMYPDHDQSLPIYAILVKVKIQADDAESSPTVDEIIQRLMTDYIDAETLGLHIFQIGEEYYRIALKMKTQSLTEDANENFLKAIDVWDRNINQIADSHHQCMAYYAAGLCHWHLEEWYLASESFFKSLQIDPDFQHAGAMHWMISSCYQKLQDVGVFTDEQAGPVIEWGYQTLFDEYPDGRKGDVEHAAMQLGRINLERDKPVTAFLYFNWILDRVEPDDGRVAAIQMLLK